MHMHIGLKFRLADRDLSYLLSARWMVDGGWWMQDVLCRPHVRLLG